MNLLTQAIEENVNLAGPHTHAMQMVRSSQQKLLSTLVEMVEELQKKMLAENRLNSSAEVGYQMALVDIIALIKQGQV